MHNLGVYVCSSNTIIKISIQKHGFLSSITVLNNIYKRPYMWRRLNVTKGTNDNFWLTKKWDFSERKVSEVKNWKISLLEHFLVAVYKRLLSTSLFKDPAPIFYTKTGIISL